jgi:AcrR family transcriptional regulator
MGRQKYLIFHNFGRGRVLVLSGLAGCGSRRAKPMNLPAKLSGQERREAILKAVRGVFVEKGFHGTTTRELAKAAGVSEALLFKHFPSKEALYSAIQLSCSKEEALRHFERLEALEASTASLVFLIHHLISHLLGDRMVDEHRQSFLRLVLRSLMDEGDFARLAIRGGPSHWVRKVEESLRAAIAAGDAVDGQVRPSLAGWFVNQMAAMVMIHLLPTQPVIDFGVPREELVEQAVWFSLRGMGLKDEAIRRWYNAEMRERDGVRPCD